ncbi:probable serine/threonine-protein kinase DDB_G0293958 [Episyrphus balteatus]|uniref:probable serine/threonine-protein kinase DDB_G0293958 n=1 Tax=Episyrphus balteatus TaxID=286459 RepID=UPI002485C161|nr:probable serine/threonine-protein kinase DDB_G0293958 [Episyrphus balteatus]
MDQQAAAAAVAAVAAVAAAQNNNGSNININNNVLIPRVLELNPLKYIERLSTFDGKTQDLPIFISNVDDIIPTLLTYNDQGQRMCINLLKSKFIGRARQTIEIHSHLTQWADIKAILIQNFGGFKNSYQLYDDLRAAQFKGDVLKYYNYIQRTLSLLNQKCLQENNQLDVPRNNETALKIFKEKLPVHMRTILYSLKPSSMEAALHELSEAGFVTHNSDSKPQSKNESPKNDSNFRKNSNNRNNNHNYNNKNNQRQNNNYQRTYENKQYPQQVEPMDIDPSSSQVRRINKTNYINKNTEHTEANFRDSASEIHFPILRATNSLLREQDSPKEYTKWRTKPMTIRTAGNSITVNKDVIIPKN